MLLAVLASFGAGVTNVLARTCNARLSRETSYVKSTFYNYGVGLFCALVVMLPARQALSLLFQPLPAPAWAYLGGLVGVGVIALLNITVARLASFTATLLLFVGQVLTGVVLDIFLSGAFSPGNLVGGCLVAVGLVVNLLLDRKTETGDKEG